MVSSVFGVFLWGVGRLQRDCARLQRLPLFVSVGADFCPGLCCFGACAGHVPPLWLCCTRSFVNVAQRGVLVAQRFSWFCPNFGWLGFRFEQRIVFSWLCEKVFFWSKWFSLPLFLVVPVVVRPLTPLMSSKLWTLFPSKFSIYFYLFYVLRNMTLVTKASIRVFRPGGSPLYRLVRNLRHQRAGFLAVLV